MNCPHCHEKLEPGYSAPWCPFCGKNFTDEARKPQSADIPRRKFNWLFFSIVLCAPLVAVFISQSSGFDSLNESLRTLVTYSFGGSAVSGLICGVFLARWRGLKGLKLLSETIAYSILMAIVSFGVCCVGCVAAPVIYSAFHK